MKPLRDEALIRAIREGDEGAIAQVMDRYSPLLWRVAGAVLGRRAAEEDLEECVADVFIHLWQQPEKFDPRRGTLKTYLALMARSRATDRLRQLLRREEVPLEAAPLQAAAGVAEGYLARETLEELRRAVDDLEEPDREILLRRWQEEQTPREIALAMGLAPKQVENRLYRTRLRLRRAVSE